MGNEKVELKPVGYSKTTAGVPTSTARRAAIAVGNSERRLADPAPDPTDPRVVGRYERDDALETLQVNQAGSFIVCWHVDPRLLLTLFGRQ